MKTLKTTRYQLNIHRPDITSNTVRLAFLTDLHNAENGQGNQQLLDAIRKENPDLILCGGDMIVAKEGRPADPVDKVRDFMCRLSEEYTIYHALGNHESRCIHNPELYGDLYNQYKKPLENAGIFFLENASDLITAKGIPIQITGYEVPKKNYNRVKPSDLLVSEMEEQVGKPNPMAINILLAHHPGYVDTYNNWGADLILCGHNHGGIIKFGKHRGLISPSLKLFSPTCYGHHQFQKRIENGQEIPHEAHQIIGAGLGEHTFPIRINNPRELVIVEMHIIG